MKKGTDGVHLKRGENRKLLYYWRVANEKSKDFTSHEECAKEFVTRYIERYPKYKELVYDKSWEEIFRVFGIQLEG